ncbi:MAG TPA: DUF1553 domain-containing protein [Terriglobia bacterium]|nr:DUF1553 domain-containing protein [Terriglobia bacterium]
MYRVLWILPLTSLLCLAADNSQKQEKKPVVDSSNMSSDVHAPLFQGPKLLEAGANTERLASGLPKPTGPMQEVPRRNFIDNHIFGKMERDGVPHAPPASDQEFFRRITLDLTGRIPTPSEVLSFMRDTSPDKRARVIDRLIGSPAFVDKWSYFYMDLLRANGKMGRGVQLFHYMLKESLASDRPYDDFVRSLIAGSAKSNLVVASVNPIVREHVEGKPGQVETGDDLRKVHQIDTHDELTILYGKVFLGVNLSCISCHDGAHHLEKVNVYLSQRKRADFFQQAAFLGNTRYIPHVERSEALMGHFIVDDLGRGYDTKSQSMLRIERSGGPSQPKFMLTDELPRRGAEPREELARLLTSHPQFARATVNLYWSKLMGLGIVEPADEFDLARQDPKHIPAGWELQPSHPELLDALAADFRKTGYSLHSLFRTICNSSAYQLSARFPGQWSERYTRYYARKYARMLTAEELHDSIALATDRPGSFGGGRRKPVLNDEEPAGPTVSMAMQMAVPRSSGELKSFMQAFGQSNRGAPARPPQASPLQPIMLMRSPVVNDRVLAAKDSRVQRLLASSENNGRVVEELFLATLSRQPTPEEKTMAVSFLDKDRVEGAQNVQWALLNLVEFLYNF